MRVCLVSREFSPRPGSDVAAFALHAAAAWAGLTHEPRPGDDPVRADGAHPHEVHVLTEPAPARLVRRLMPAARVHTLDQFPAPRPRGAFKFDFQLHAMRVLLALRTLHARHPFDAIEFPSLAAEGAFAIQSRLASGDLPDAVLCVRLHHASRRLRELNAEAWVTEELATLDAAEEACIRNADLLLAHSHATLDAARHLRGGRAHAVIPPLFVPSLARPRPEPSSACEILCPGPLDRARGVDLFLLAALTLLERAPATAPLRFRFSGMDSRTGRGGRSMLNDLRSRLPARFADRFTFDEPASLDDQAASISRARVVCFPARVEALPFASLQARALGVPIVATPAAGLAPSPHLHVAQKADAASLADALARALDASPPALPEPLPSPRDTIERLTDLVREVRPSLRSTPAGPRAAGDEPAASFVIAYYNLGPLIRETLRSLAAQTSQDFETIIIDDGSSDPDSLRVIDDLARDPALRVIRQPNRGLGAARNAGLAAARGRWIVPLDADDLLEPDFLERALLAARLDPGATAISSLVTLFHRRPGDLDDGWIPIGFERDLLSVLNCASCCTALIDREALLDAGGYDEWLTSLEDWDLWCSLARRDARALIIPDFLIHTRVRENSLTRTEVAHHGPRLASIIHARHPHLALDAGRALALRLSGAGGFDAQARAREIVGSNIRYRLADRLNIALKRAGMQAAIKRLAKRVLRSEGRSV